MIRTVIGTFASAAAAQGAEAALIDRGYTPSLLHGAIQEGDAPSVETEDAGQLVRDFFSELLGTRPSAEVGHYSDLVQRGGAILAVEAPEGVAVEPIRRILLDAGAVEIDERLGPWRP